MNTGINRIRLEFKDRPLRRLHKPLLCINRIRLEFKGHFLKILLGRYKIVLIESDWNLKTGEEDLFRITITRINRIRLEFKEGGEAPPLAAGTSINRIRLEFKVYHCRKFVSTFPRINRIRLEFKVSMDSRHS